jgi:integrase
MPVFISELRNRHGLAALALEFTILTCVRTTDVRLAKWENIDRPGKLWIIPHMSKTGREHRVPLSTAALAVLDKVQKIAGEIGGQVAQSEHIFTNDVTGAPLSENAMLAVLKRMGRKGTATTHGFRSSFRTWAQEETDFEEEIVEHCLHHITGDDAEKAYKRGEALRKRRVVMQAFADFATRAPKSSVTPMRAA